MKIIIYLLSALLLSGCGKEEGCVLHINGSAEILDKAYPNGYPSMHPKNNAAMTIFENGRFEVIDKIIGKDYMMYKVETESGKEGYIVHSHNTYLSPEGCVPRE